MENIKEEPNFKEVKLKNLEAVNRMSARSPMANFGVNLSSGAINVYSSAGGGSTVGRLNVRECFAFTGGRRTINGSEWHSIEFLSPNGWRGGWYKGVSGVSLWKNRPYSTSSVQWCTCKAGSFKGNFKYYKVMKQTSVKNSSGNHAFYVYPGDLVMVSSSDTPSGSSYHHLMKIKATKSTGNRAQLLCCCHQTGEHFGFVDTGINRTSSSPNIRGNW